MATSLTFIVVMRALELVAKYELDDSRIGCRGHLTERTGTVVGGDGSKVGVVQNVEEFGSKFDILPFGDTEGFLKREVEVDQTRSANGAGAGVAKVTRGGSRECGGI